MALPRTLPALLPSAPAEVAFVTNAVITNAGMTLLAGALINSGANAAVTFVAIGAGTGLLASGITAGVAITALPVQPLAANVAGGQHLTIIFDTFTDTVTAASGGAVAGATSIPILTWTPTYAFPSGSGLVNTPAVTDGALQNELARVEISAGTVGANPGETLISGYFDPTTASGTYLEVGYFGGASASLTAGSGILVARDIMWWQHTVNVDSFTNQLDSVV